MVEWLKSVDCSIEEFKKTDDFKSFIPMTSDANDNEIMNATAGVYFQWLDMQSKTRNGSITKHEESCDLIYIPPDNNSTEDEEDGRGMGILFPSDNGEHIDSWLNWFRSDECNHKMAISCWAADKNNYNLAKKLYARGFSSGFISNWLVLDMNHTSLDCSHFRFLDGVQFRILRKEEDENVWKNCEEGHPCYKDSIKKTKQMHDASRLSSGKLVMFAAFIEDEPIASATLYLGQGENYGVAGLYEVEVVRKYRGKGIGKAISYATCHYSKELGYRYVLGNASDEGVPMYYKLGFRDFGRGLVYFIPKSFLSNPVTEKEIEFIEAIGDNNVSTLEKLVKEFKTKKLSNGFTPIQIAMKLSLPDVASWLHSHGCILDIFSAWELGWGEELQLLVMKYYFYKIYSY